MPSTSDVLLPILGGIAGMNPYIGSGVRTALSVSEALARKKWKEQDKIRQQEEEEAAAEASRIQAERDAADAERLQELIKTSPLVPPEKRQIYAELAKRDPKTALKELEKLEQKEEAQFVDPASMGSYADEMRGVFGDDAGFGLTFEGEYGPVSPYFHPEKQQQTTVEEAFKPKYKNPKPWLTTWMDEGGQQQFSVNEALKSLLNQETGQEDDYEKAIREARLNVRESQAELQEYVESRSDTGEQIKTVDGRYVPKEHDFSADARYHLLEAKLDDATENLRQLVEGYQAPQKPQEQKQQAAPSQDDGDTLYFDIEGNQIRQ